MENQIRKKENTGKYGKIREKIKKIGENYRKYMKRVFERETNIIHSVFKKKTIQSKLNDVIAFSKLI